MQNQIDSFLLYFLRNAALLEITTDQNLMRLSLYPQDEERPTLGEPGGPAGPGHLCVHPFHRKAAER
jgi:hypothetical protein